MTDVRYWSAFNDIRELVKEAMLKQDTITYHGGGRSQEVDAVVNDVTSRILVAVSRKVGG